MIAKFGITVDKDRIGLPLVWQPADVPGWAWCELTVTGTTLEFAVDEAADRIAAVAGVAEDR